MGNYLTCGQVARKLRISTSTLKRWMNEPTLTINELRNHNGWRLFSEEQVKKLWEFKRQLKRNGRRFNQATLMPINALNDGSVAQKKRMHSDVQGALML